MFMLVGYSWLQSKRAPVIQVRASVARKRFIATPLTRFITFGIPFGEQELVVPESVYSSSDEGQWGILTYQGEHFKQFIPEPKEEGQAPGPPKPPQPLNPDYHEH